MCAFEPLKIMRLVLDWRARQGDAGVANDVAHFLHRLGHEDVVVLNPLRLAWSSSKKGETRLCVFIPNLMN